MRSVLLLLVVAISAVSCGRLQPYFAVLEDWDYAFDDGGIQFSSLDELFTWVRKEVVYSTDSQLWGWTEYWATPEQTYQARRGDCEDFALLFMYYAYTRQIDPNPELVAILAPGGYGHALVRIGDTYYDPEGGTRSVSEMTDTVWYVLNYGQAIYIAANNHDAWKGIAGEKELSGP